MMDGFDRAGSVFTSRVSEVLGNLRVRRTHAFFVRFQGELFNRENMRGELKGDLNRALDIKNASVTVAYRGLILQLYGAFERFITDLAEAALENAKNRARKFSDLDEHLRNAYTVGSARLLVKFHDKTVNGVPFDFGALQTEMAACFSDQTNFRLSAGAFTALLGVCTSERVDWVFETLRLGRAFDDALGRDSGLRTWSKKAGSRETLSLARDKLNSIVRLRNQIAHGVGDPDVSDSEVEETATFFLVLTEALLAKARSAHR